MGIIELKMCN